MANDNEQYEYLPLVMNKAVGITSADEPVAILRAIDDWIYWMKADLVEADFYNITLWRSSAVGDTEELQVPELIATATFRSRFDSPYTNTSLLYTEDKLLLVGNLFASEEEIAAVSIDRQTKAIEVFNAIMWREEQNRIEQELEALVGATREGDKIYLDFPFIGGVCTSNDKLTVYELVLDSNEFKFNLEELDVLNIPEEWSTVYPLVITTTGNVGPSIVPKGLIYVAQIMGVVESDTPTPQAIIIEYLEKFKAIETFVPNASEPLRRTGKLFAGDVIYTLQIYPDPDQTDPYEPTYLMVLELPSGEVEVIIKSITLYHIDREYFLGYNWEGFIDEEDKYIAYTRCIRLLTGEIFDHQALYNPDPDDFLEQSVSLLWGTVMSNNKLEAFLGKPNVIPLLGG